MTILEALRANVSYLVLTVCCTRSPSHQAWAQTPPNFGSARWQFYQIPVDHIQHTLDEQLHSTFVMYQGIYLIGFQKQQQWHMKFCKIVAHTCTSSSSLFFLPSDWFLWGNRKSSAAVGTPGNTATKSCSSGKSDTCDKAEINFISHHTVTDYFFHQ